MENNKSEDNKSETVKPVFVRIDHLFVKISSIRGIKYSKFGDCYTITTGEEGTGPDEYVINIRMYKALCAYLEETGYLADISKSLIKYANQ